MAQTTFSIRMDEETKQGMERICESLGVSMSSAFNMFAKAFVRNDGFPFDIRLTTAKNDAWSAFLKAREILRKRFSEEPSLEQIEEELKNIRSKS